MIKRNALLLVAGAAIFALNGSAASAQAKPKPKPKSTRKIPIHKEPTVVAAPRVDTVTVYRTDTLRMMGRVDTITRTNTVTTVRVDTVIQQVPVLPARIGGTYIGLGLGPNLPFGAIRTVNQPGIVGQVNLGWQRVNSPLGIRLDGTVTQYAHAADYAFLGDKPMVYNANLDLRLNIPIMNGFLGSAIQMTPYVIGGGSFLYYKDLRMALETPPQNGIPPQFAVIAGSPTTGSPVNDSYEHSWGWNLGGGLGFHAGKKEVFAEARWIHFTREDNRFGTSWAIPITFGVNFF